MADSLADFIRQASQQLGIDPLDLATAISYETAGSFDPLKKGPTTQWGQHKGLIQWGEPQAQKYLGGDFSIPSQAKGMVGYLKDAGVKPGMGLMDVYSAINAGSVGRYGASDANNGGAPGTVADKVNGQMAGHRAKAEVLLGNSMPRLAASDFPPPALSGIGSPPALTGNFPAAPSAPPPTPAASTPPNGLLAALGMNDKQAGNLGSMLSMLGQQSKAPEIAPMPAPQAQVPALMQMVSEFLASRKV